MNATPFDPVACLDESSKAIYDALAVIQLIVDGEQHSSLNPAMDMVQRLLNEASNDIDAVSFHLATARRDEPITRLLPRWHDLTTDLMPLCNPNAQDLAALSAPEVERMRADAETLAALVGTWQVLHPPEASVEAT